MVPVLSSPVPMTDMNGRVTETLIRERKRLGDFIRRRVPDPSDAEDILQDVFIEFVAAYRLPESIEQVGAWLIKVARHRIIDRFRKKREAPLPEPVSHEDGPDSLEDLLPSADAGPEAAYARKVLMEELINALEELPPEQRSIFVAHELEGRSFAEMAEENGVPLNTLLARKRYAVLHLRRRLQHLYDEFLR